MPCVRVVAAKLWTVLAGKPQRVRPTVHFRHVAASHHLAWLGYVSAETLGERNLEGFEVLCFLTSPKNYESAGVKGLTTYPDRPGHPKDLATKDDEGVRRLEYPIFDCPVLTLPPETVSHAE